MTRRARADGITRLARHAATAVLLALLSITSSAQIDPRPSAPASADSNLRDENARLTADVERLSADVERLTSQVNVLSAALSRSAMPLAESKRQDAIDSLTALRRALSDGATFPEFTAHYVDATRKTTALPDVITNSPIREVLAIYADINALKLAALTQYMSPVQIAQFSRSYGADRLIGRFAGEALAGIPADGFRPTDEEATIASATARVELLSRYLETLAASKISALQ